MSALTTRNHKGLTNSTDPFTALARDFFGFDPFSSNAPRTRSLAQQLPHFDLIETETAYTLNADLPGITEDNLDITVHEGVLTVSGKREEESKQEGASYLVRERRLGEFERRLMLPKDANPEAVEAKLDNGVLTIAIPKKEQRMARKIKIG